MSRHRLRRSTRAAHVSARACVVRRQCAPRRSFARRRRASRAPSPRTRARPREGPRTVPRTYTFACVVVRGSRDVSRTDEARGRAQDASRTGVGALLLRHLTRACAVDATRGRGNTRAVVVGAWTRPCAWFVEDESGRARAVDARVVAADARDERPLRDAIVDAVAEVSARVGTARASDGGEGEGARRRGGVLAPTRRARATTACALDCASRVERTFGAGALVRLVRALRSDERVSVVFTLSVGAESCEGERAIEAEASCAVTCRDAPGDETATTADLDVDVRRASGRRKRERERVTIRGDDALDFSPIEVESVERAVARALRVAGAAVDDDDDDAARAARRLQSSVPFDLGVRLTAEEREARRNVRLSYEHQGLEGVDAYARGDALAYLPVHAGGRGDAINRTRPAITHVRYELDDADRELDDDDLFPDTDDDADDF